jgi:hypothetical protein
MAPPIVFAGHIDMHGVPIVTVPVPHPLKQVPL